jgi:hypothetical protein
MTTAYKTSLQTEAARIKAKIATLRNSPCSRLNRAARDEEIANWQQNLANVERDLRRLEFNKR